MGCRAARPSDKHQLIKLDRGHLRIFTAPEASAYLGGLPVPAAPAMAALGFVSRDLAHTRAFLKGRGVKLAEDSAKRLIVDASDGMGAYLVIS